MQVSSLNFDFNILGKGEQNKPKANRMKGIKIKKGTEVNKI
jgi:hypothetical protein